MTRILHPSHPAREIGDIHRRLEAQKRSPLLNNFPLISSVNSATQNQAVPPAGNFNGTTKYDVGMNFTCVFTLTAPTPIIWFSYATLILTAPVGGFFAYLTTAVSLSPWNPAMVIFESGSQIFDVRNTGYLQSEHHFAIALAPTQGSIGPGAAPLGILSNQGPLPAGTYEVRQRMIGDAGTLANYYQGNIEVYAPGG